LIRGPLRFSNNKQ